jgi:uncharacterized protein YndB with AHSA1/START domain
MEERSFTHSTFVIERSYPVSPERVFSAFANAETKRRWYAASRSIDVEEFKMDFRIGGRDHAGYRFKEGSPFPGTPLLYDTVYHDIVPNRLIVSAYTMTLGDKRVSTSLNTFEFLPTDRGADMIFTEQGAYTQNSGGPQMREEGWRSLFEELAKELAG